MSVVLLGYHNMGCRALDALLDEKVKVSAVFTHRDNPNENVWFDSLAELSKKNNIPVYFPEDINEEKWIRLLKEINPDLILSCYFRQMVKRPILDIPRLGAFNLHGSLLPKYRGRCPVNWQLLHGERESGVTLHYMVEKADAGDIVAQKRVEVDIKDNAVTLFKKLEDAAYEVIKTYVPMILNGTAPRIPQDHSKATYFGGRRPEDGRINWENDAFSIYNLIRAVTWPYPGAFCELEGQRLYIWEADFSEKDDIDGRPGQVVKKGNKVFVKTGKGSLEIIRASLSKRPSEKENLPEALFQKGIILK